MTAHVCKGRPTGVLSAPPSKSMAHRLLICAALAKGQSMVQNLDFSEDIMATLGALRALGADALLETDAAGLKGASPFDVAPRTPVHCNESGSTLRFLIPLFALSGKPVTFTGAGRLFSRPLKPYADLFAQRNLRFELAADRLLVQGPLTSGRYVLRGDVSSQFISGLLFALPLLDEDSTISIMPPFESRGYVEMTRAAQRQFGVESTWESGGLVLRVPGRQCYRPRAVTAEGDWSSAAVPAVMAAVCGGIDIEGLSPESAQADKAIVDILQRAGARVEWRSGLLRVRPGTGPLLAPGDIDLANCPDLGPILCTLALFCKGRTYLVNAGRLRIKESDRIASMETELGKLGAAISSDASSVRIEGGRALAHDAMLQSHADHRVVMALTAAAVCGDLALGIQGAEAVCKSWPGFFEDMRSVGVMVDEA